MTVLENTRALIIDMDGVLWHGNTPMLGLTGFFEVLRATKVPFILATNNASLTQTAYVEKFASMGVMVSEQEILTSSMVTASYLAARYDAANTRVFVIGESGLTAPLAAQGFILTDVYEVKTADKPNAGADLVVSGLDRQLSWDKLATASIHLQNGATLIGSNSDPTLPTELGLMWGNGATLAGLEKAANVKAITIGKPEPIIYQYALALLGTTADETAAIGDRLDTDILGAVNAGMRSLLVLSGTSTRTDIEQIDYQPTWVLDSISDITEILRSRQ